MSSDVTETELTAVRDWARAQLAKGDEPPWSAFLLARLAETIDALLAGRAADASEQTPKRASSGPDLRLVVSSQDPKRDN